MIKTILFDFDGVIIDSMSIRNQGFRIIAKEVTEDESVINEFIKYHRYNAGLSRFVKIRYLYEKLLNKLISEVEINRLADEFSKLMKSKLVDKSILIKETVEFIKSIHKDFNLHIVSGSEENELNYLCLNLELSNYFKTIEGSPTHKNDLVKNILKKHNYDPKECILIGDSINDYEAASINKVDFYAYNNKNIKQYGNYIDSFKEFKL